MRLDVAKAVERFSADIPIWHTVSCLCKRCLLADLEHCGFGRLPAGRTLFENDASQA